MRLFDYIYKNITPNDVAIRYRPLIEHICALNPNLKEISISNEKVV